MTAPTIPSAALSTPDPTRLRDRFRRLAEEWKQQSHFLSNTAQMAMLRPYQRIIGMGLPVVPLILEELQREPDHWFWALEAITEENPVPPEAAGKVHDMARAWLDWFINESGFANDQQAVPPAVGQPLPEVLKTFAATGVDLVELPAATTNAGKEDEIIKQSEIDLTGNIYRQKLVDIARGAAKGSKDSYFADLNKRWGAAQAQVMK